MEYVTILVRIMDHLPASRSFLLDKDFQISLIFTYFFLMVSSSQVDLTRFLAISCVN